MKKRRKLLINHVYYNPVGHVLEALKMAKGFSNVNKDLDISVALNKETAYELAKACPWIKKYYAVDTRDILKKGKAAESFKELPKNWDYVVHDFRILNENAGKKNLWDTEKAMVNYYDLVRKNLNAKWQGDLWNKEKYPNELKYKPNSKIELSLPKSAIDFIKKNYPKENLRISLMLGGSASREYYPSIKTWEKIIKALGKKIPNSKIYLTGISKSEDGKTNTQAYSEKELKHLNKLENIVNAYDIGLWNQIALLKSSDLFISPHTGFGFLAPWVNTPWLAISGGDWPEYFFNNVPFYSVFPDDKNYPYVGKGKWTKHAEINHKKRIPTFSPKKLDKKIPEIVDKSKVLINKKLPYKEAVKLHVNNILKKGFDINKFGALDDALGLKKLKKELVR